MTIKNKGAESFQEKDQELTFYNQPNKDDMNLEIQEDVLRIILNSKELQSLMNDFYKLTNIGVGIIDLKGNVLVSTGWQEICTDFHRVNPETRKACTESDFYLGSQSKQGEFLKYKCKNNLWDIATPIFIARKRVAHLFLGQFFYEDEEVDYEFFSRQAKTHGFDEKAYLSALDKVPRWSRETVDAVMGFYTKFIRFISRFSTLLLEKMDEESKERKKEFQGMFNSAMDAFLIFDLEGNIIEANAKATEMYGYEHDEMTRLAGNDIVHPDYLHLYEKAVEAVLTKGHALLESKDIRKDGSTFHVEVNGRFYEYKGKPRILGIIRDISERKEAEQKIKDGLTQSNFYKDLLAHDMNNILSNIKLSSELLDMIVDSPKDGITARRFIDNIKEQVERGANLISNVRNLSLLEKDGSEARPIQFYPLLEQIISSIQSKYKVKHVQISRSIPNEDLMIKGGPLLENVFQNLLMNAIIHNENESVKIWIYQSLILKDSKKYLKLEFKDNGIGIEDERKARLFDPRSGKDGSSGGMGIGLSLIHHIIKAYGGEIWVEDRVKGNPDQGSNFILLFERR